MAKRKNLWLMLDAIFLVIFNTLFFVLGGTDHTASVWISYGFVHFAYLMLLITGRLARAGESAGVFGYTLYGISSLYFVAEAVVGLTFILVAPEGYKAALVLQLLLAGAYGSLLISNMIANEQTADSEQARRVQIDYVNRATAEMASIMSGVGDRNARRAVEQAYDAINSSPVKSHPELSEVEGRILVVIADLRSVVDGGAAGQIQARAEALLALVNDRNRQLKLLH